jgi:hypothetical protein
LASFLILLQLGILNDKEYRMKKAIVVLFLLLAARVVKAESMIEILDIWGGCDPQELTIEILD